VGTTPATATNAALGASLAGLNAGIAAAYQAHAERYKKLLANSTSIETPDKALNEAFQWAVVSIEQLRAKAQPTGETALVAGYYASGDSARPGFGWFFGRDALYTLYAVNGYGDFALSKAELEFLIRRQRTDGKIMHEYSQISAAIDWQAFPYMYAAADATPLFLLAVADYVRSSGDVAFLAAHREAIEKAWTFESTHDSDGDGIYDNAQGTGWVESWPGAMPHQEIYLALLDQQASDAMAKIENLLKDSEKGAAAQKRADTIAKIIEAEYYDASKLCYAFSHNADGSLDRASTVYPALAWWSGKSILANPEGCLKQFAAHTLQTDWGLRDVSTDEKLYDGMSYHQGSVWPLFTGWAALAEYRANQPLAGYQMLMENANLTRAQDLGAVTELLSGDVFVPFGRSTSHQLWSSAMVITPTLRGLFGIDIDAQTKTITVNPHLPAQWGKATVRNIPLLGGAQSLVFSKEGGHLTVGFTSFDNHGWRIRSDLPGAKFESKNQGVVAIPLPELEIIPERHELDIPVAGQLNYVAITAEIGSGGHDLTAPGSRTGKFRVLSEKYGNNKATFEFEGMADSRFHLILVRHKLLYPKFTVDSTQVNNPDFHPVSLSLVDTALTDFKLPILMGLHFPPGEGWKTITVTLTW